MKIEVSEDTIKATIECKKNFSCLTCKREDLCTVERVISKDLMYFKCMNKNYCSYQMTFGSFYICICPTRREIYDRYKI